jgi:hypothetical protein
MKFRSILIALMAFVLAGSVACAGGDKKQDEAPTEESTETMEGDEAAEEPAEEAPAEEGGMEEETPAESAPAPADDPAAADAESGEEGGDAAPAEGEEGE